MRISKIITTIILTIAFVLILISCFDENSKRTTDTNTRVESEETNTCKDTDVITSKDNGNTPKNTVVTELLETSTPWLFPSSVEPTGSNTNSTFNTSENGKENCSKATSIHKETENNMTKATENMPVNTTPPIISATPSDKNVSYDVTWEPSTPSPTSNTPESNESHADTTGSYDPIELEEIDF